MSASSRIYYVSFAPTTFAAASGDYDFFEFNSSGGTPIELIALYIGQTTELGDAQEEQVHYDIRRFIGGSYTSGSVGATANVYAADPSTGALSGSMECANATVGTSTGTTQIIWNDTFNIRSGLQLVFPPEARPISRTNMVVRMVSALADDATMTGTAIFREL